MTSSTTTRRIVDQQEQSLYLWRTLRRGWKIVIGTILLTVAAAVGVSYMLPVHWEATAVLTVEPLTAVPLSAGSAANTQVNMNTETVVARSTEVLRRATEDLNGPSVAEISRGLSISVPKGSQILEFSYTASSATEAPEVANAVASAYNRHRIENAERVIDETTDSLVDRVVELGQKRDATAEGTPQYETLSLQIATLQERQASLAAATFYPGTLVSPAITPVNPANFSLKIFVAAGGFLGLVLGFVAALGFDRYVEYRIANPNPRKNALTGSKSADEDPTAAEGTGSKKDRQDDEPP